MAVVGSYLVALCTVHVPLTVQHEGIRYADRFEEEWDAADWAQDVHQAQRGWRASRSAAAWAEPASHLSRPTCAWHGDLSSDKKRPDPRRGRVVYTPSLTHRR